MKMRVLLFGATGMVGKGTLLEALDDDAVGSVVVVVRKSLQMQHPKLTEILHKDFAHYDGVDFSGFDACLFCLGISSAGLKEPEYTRITFDYLAAAAQKLKEQSPNAVFCFISGEGTDVNSSTMWSRVKGRAEQEVFRLFGDNGFVFRPGYIRPERGVGPAAGWIKTAYTVMRPLEGVFRVFMKDKMTTSTTLGKALVKVAKDRKAPKQTLHTVDVNALMSA